MISTKLCEKCFKIMDNIDDIKQTAIRQNTFLKEKYEQCLSNKGIRIPNTCIIIRKDIRAPLEETLSTTNEVQVEAPDRKPPDYSLVLIQPKKGKRIKGIKGLHPSVVEVYKKYPGLKLSKKCLDKNLDAAVSFAMGEVELYFKSRNLDMNKHIYRPTSNSFKKIKRVARKKTSTIFRNPLNLHKSNIKLDANSLVTTSETIFNNQNIDSLNLSQDSSRATNNLEDSNSLRSFLLSKFKDNKHVSIKQVDSSSQAGVHNRSVKDTCLKKDSAIKEYSSSSNNKTAFTNDQTAGGTTKPEFIQSLGLTPALAAVEDPLSCKICNRVQSNALALKKHCSNHRICPFCKIKFRTIETKQNHIINNCEVRKIMESSGSFVDLEKIDLDDKLKRKYEGALSELEINGKAKRKIMDTHIKSNNVVVLTDDEEVVINSSLNEDVRESETIGQVIITDDSSNILKPIIRICKDTIIDPLRNDLSDKNLVKELMTLLYNPQLNRTEESVQVPPLQKRGEIVIKNEKCRLKGLKSHLYSYTIPVNLSYGNFHVSYSDNVEFKKADRLQSWDDIPVVDKRASREIQLLNATYPLTFLTSQVQSLSSIQLMTTTPTMSFFLPNTSAFLPSTSLSLQPTVTQTQTISNTFFGSLGNASIQTTPLLQNYALSMTPLPIISNQVPVQSNGVNSTATNNETVSNIGTAGPGQLQAVASSSRSADSGESSSGNSGAKTENIIISPGSSLAKRSSSKRKHSRKRPIIKVKIGQLASGSSKSSKSSKLRVKNIWELK